MAKKLLPKNVSRATKYHMRTHIFVKPKPKPKPPSLIPTVEELRSDLRRSDSSSSSPSPSHPATTPNRASSIVSRHAYICEVPHPYRPNRRLTFVYDAILLSNGTEQYHPSNSHTPPLPDYVPSKHSRHPIPDLSVYPADDPILQSESESESSRSDLPQKEKAAFRAMKNQTTLPNGERVTYTRYIERLFCENEERAPNEKLTDEELLNTLLTAFPNRDPTDERNLRSRRPDIQRLRQRYNAGHLHCQPRNPETGYYMPPAVQSYRYVHTTDPKLKMPMIVQIGKFNEVKGFYLPEDDPYSEPREFADRKDAANFRDFLVKESALRRQLYVKMARQQNRKNKQMLKKLSNSFKDAKELNLLPDVDI